MSAVLTKINQLETQLAQIAKELAALKLNPRPKPENRPILCLFDLETTGIGKTKFIKICEIGGVNYATGDTYQQYVNPGVPVPDSAVSVHHITNEMLRTKPRWKEVQPAWEGWLEEQRPSPDVPLILGGFNSKRYDSRILTFHTEYSYPPNVLFVDFREVFADCFPDIQGRKSLGGYYQHVLNKDITSAHTAVADAKAIVDICVTMDQDQLFELIAKKQETSEGVVKRCLK